LAWDDVNKEYTSAHLSNVLSRQVGNIFRVSAGSNIVEVSENHGFWLDGGAQIKVTDIIVGETKIYVKDGDTQILTIVDSVKEIFGEYEVYTFRVPKFENYISNNIVSHNPLQESFPIIDSDDFPYPFTFSVNNLSLTSGTTYYVYMRSLSTYTVLDTVDGEIYNRTQLNNAVVNIVPLTSGVIINGGGFQTVVDADNYIRFRTNPGSDAYYTDLRGGISIDEMYGYDIAGSALAYLKAGYPWVVKGYGKIYHTTAADTTPSGTDQASFQANVGFSSVSVSTSIQGYYNVSYTETFTGKYPTVLVTLGIGPVYTGVVGADALDAGKVSVGVGQYSDSGCRLYVVDQVQNDLENAREMSLLLLA
jgi:hypothetical protein